MKSQLDALYHGAAILGDTESKPARILRPLPQETATFTKVAFICNINKMHVDPIIDASFGIYHIAVPGPDERYALTQIDWAPTYMDKGDSAFNLMRGPKRPGDGGIEDNRIKGMQGALEIAQDLCQRMNTSDGPPDASGAGPFWGKFVLKSVDNLHAQPTEAELVDAEHRMRTYFLRVVARGDSDWSRAGRHDMIDGRCKIAANYLGITNKEWMKEPQASVNCPACQEQIKPGAKVCKHCHTILDTQAVTPEKKGRRGKKQEDAPEIEI